MMHIVCLLLASLRPAAAGQEAQAPFAPRVDEVMAEWSKPDSPGCAVGIVEGDALVLARGYGQADLERDVRGR